MIAIRPPHIASLMCIFTLASVSWFCLVFRITQESLLRLADVGYHTFKIWTSKVLKTVDQESFHPWLPLSEEEEFAEKQRISKTPDSNVRNAQNKWVNDVLGQRRRHKADYFDRVDQDFKMNFKEATTSIKALGVSCVLQQ